MLLLHWIFDLRKCSTESLSERQKLSILSTIDAIHDRGVLHNDIKKENMLVDSDGTVYLIDFGFATIDCSKTELESERYLLQKCLESL